MKYKIWILNWIELYVKPIGKERTYKKYRQQINQYIIPCLGEEKIKKLTADKLQAFTVELSKKGLSASTVSGILSVVKASLKRAVSVGLIDSEFTEGIVKPKKREKQIECFSKDEQKKIEKYLLENNDPKLFGIIISLYTGLRIGELLALKWTDVDFKSGTLTVDKTCYDSWENGKYVKVIESPKTENSVRVIPIPKQLLQRMKEYRKTSSCKYVVGKEKEYGVQVRSYQKTYELTLKKIGLKRKGFHSLRHTFATRALECGMDVKTLSEILGHKDPAVTLRRYAHSMLEHKTEMMNRVGKLMLQK